MATQSMTRTKYYALKGGLDVVTSSLNIAPGKALSMVNFEPWYMGGYRRIPGFERFDGRPKPHRQSFTAFEVSSIGDIEVGDTITGSESAATGVVIGIHSNADNSKNDVIGVTKTTGVFEKDEYLETAASNVTRQLRPSSVATASAGFIPLDSDDFTRIANGVDTPNSSTVLSDANDITGNVAYWPLGDVPTIVANVDSYQLRVRARVIKLAPPGSSLSIGPETDDEATYRFRLSVGARTVDVDFDQSDVDLGYIVRSATGTDSVLDGDIAAATVSFYQDSYTQMGELPDGLRIEIESIDVVVQYDGPIAILSNPTLLAAPSGEIEDAWLLAAQNSYRDDIGEVPGTGPVLGAYQRGANVYALRAQVSPANIALFRSSAAGWTTSGITMGVVLRFNTGLAAGDNLQEGDTVTGSVSSETAVVHRIVLNSGSVAWDGSGEGYLVLTSASGTFTEGESLMLSTDPIATVAEDSFTLTFGTGTTRFEFRNHNFFGGANTYRTYGVGGGSDFAFEIDENNVVSPIYLPPVDVDGVAPPQGQPMLLEVHRNHLFLAYPGGRIVHTIPGDPLVISGFLGSAEFGLGGEITGLNSVVGSVLVVTTVRQTRGLFGTNVTDWELRLIGRETGGKRYAMQTIDTVYGLDDLGITSMERTDAFGDFVEATLSKFIQPLLIEKRPLFTASCIVRESNQYRVYFSDNTAIVMYVPAGQNKSPEFGALSYPFAVNRIYNVEDETGAERTYFCTDDPDNQGYVFQDQVGKSFDGEVIRSYVRLAFNNLGSPANRKRFRRADLELNGSRPLDLKFVYDLSYGAANADGGAVDISLLAGGGFYDEGNWDEFYWDGQSVSTARANLTGTGENVSFSIFNETAITRPFILQGVTIHYDLRRIQR